MNNSTERNLKLKFQQLGIDVGSITENELDSWWDNDNLEEFLEFLCSLNENNVLQPNEEEWFEKNASRISPQESCEQKLLDLERYYPGIGDDHNMVEMELEYLEQTLKRLQDDKDILENEVLVDLASVKMSQIKEMDELADEIAYVDSKLATLSEENAMASFALNEAHKQLYDKIVMICTQTNEFDYGGKPTQFLEMSQDWLKFEYDLFMKHCNSVINTVCFGNSICNSTFKTPLKSDNISRMNSSIMLPPEIQSELETLQCRIATSTMSRIKAQVEKAKMCTAMNTTCNTSKAFNTTPLKESTRLNVPDNSINSVKWNSSDLFEDLEGYDNYYVKQKVDILMQSIHKLVNRIAESYANYPRVYMSQNCFKKLRLSRQRLECLKEYVTNFLNMILFISLMYRKDLKELADYETFLKTICQYCNEEVVSSKTRTDNMLRVINDYNTYRNNSLMDKFPILRTVAALVSNKKYDSFGTNEIGDVIKIFDNFNMELETFTRLTSINTETWEKTFQETLKVANVMKTFLLSGPTDGFVVLNPNLHDNFINLDNVQLKKNHELNIAVQKVNEAKTKLSKDKWFRLRRQLWIHFLTNPEKLVQIIDQLDYHLKSNVA